MKKRIISVVLLGSLVLSLAACDNTSLNFEIPKEENSAISEGEISAADNVISEDVCILDELPEYESEDEKFMAIFSDILSDAFNAIYNEKVPENIELSTLLVDSGSLSKDEKAGIGFGFCDINDDGITELVIAGKGKGESYSKLYAIGLYDCVGAFLSADIREEEKAFETKLEEGTMDFDSVLTPFAECEDLFGTIPEEEEYDVPTAVTGELQFETVDINGNTVTQDIILGSKVILLNLWEPWCGPCVNEIPELQKLYENYKESGLLIIGAYQDYDDEAQWIVNDAGVTYPIVKVDSNLEKYEQSYVPATFVFDGNGNLLDSEPVPGAMNYDNWEAFVLQYLE